MRTFYPLVFFFLLTAPWALAQMKSFSPPAPDAPVVTEEDTRIQLTGYRPGVPAAAQALTGPSYRPIPALPMPSAGVTAVQALHDDDTGRPIFIRAHARELPAVSKGRSAEEEKAYAYLEALAPLLELDQPARQFEIRRVQMDELGMTHLRMQQYWQGIPVYGGELIVHLRDGEPEMVNGRYFPRPKLTELQPQWSREAAVRKVRTDLAERTTVRDLQRQERQIMDREAVQAELVIYHAKGKQEKEHLAWHVDIYPNFAENWHYFVDARTGEVLNSYNAICQVHHHRAVDPLDGPATATATDLSGQTRTINTYELGGQYIMLDASRDMFNAAASDIPNEPVGAIFTLDANNTSPFGSGSFQAGLISSPNNSWNNPNAVSAHYNAGKSYEYFRNTFNRNSINGQGGTIYSFINVTEDNGQAMDNAFWNGWGMFYGNGNFAFTQPLARSLDVAGHEMSHGVIQNTANLEYQNESGALNESFADVFGVMIDRDDWQLGEGISNTQVFPTGFLRDMSNPNNGGSSLSDNGWQPANVSEQYFGSQDNGGVHINSGIPNYAYYLFATNPNVGKDKAEQVFYRALTTYLVRSSQFVDLRAAVVQSCQDLYGQAEVDAARAAFDQVGIEGEGDNDYEEDLPQNPGQDYILFANFPTEDLFIATPQGELIFDPLVTGGIFNRPSVTDDGSYVVAVGQDKHIYGIAIDWNNLEIGVEQLSTSPIWGNAAIAKDGRRLAAVADPGEAPDFGPFIFVFDLERGEQQDFQLTNPTYTDPDLSDGLSTANVIGADFLEFDNTGEYLIYDAQSAVSTQFGANFEYWDIGLIRVWDNASNQFGDGFIDRVFANIPENASLANPTFAKNSPYVIAFDFFNAQTGEFFLLTANIQTGEIGQLFFNDQILHYPNYAPDDEAVLFDAFDNQGRYVIAGTLVDGTKLNPVGDPGIIIDHPEEANWGVWFATGDRELVSVEELFGPEAELTLFPNPASRMVTVSLNATEAAALQLELFDALGRRVHQQWLNVGPGPNQESLSVAHLPAGNYWLRLQAEGRSAVQQLVVD